MLNPCGIKPACARSPGQRRILKASRLLRQGGNAGVERRCRMATQEKNRLFIVFSERNPAGPNDEYLALSLRGVIEDITFWLSDGGYLTGYVVSMENMLKSSNLIHDIPPWGRDWGSEWWKLKIIARGGFSVKPHNYVIESQPIEMLYCTGPTSKHRWGMVATGNITGAIDNLKEKILSQKFLEERTDVVLYSPFGKYYFSLFLRESAESMKNRGIEAIPNDQFYTTALEEKKYPHALVMIDFKTWTLSNRSKFINDGKWHHERLVCSTNPSEILEQTYKVFCALRDKENIAK